MRRRIAPPDIPAHCPGTALSDRWHCRDQEAKWARVGRKWPLMLTTLDFLVKTTACKLLENHNGGFFCVCSLGQRAIRCSRLQAGKTQGAEEQALGARSSIEEVDKRDLVCNASRKDTIVVI